ncbi:polyhydroxyalkanoate synthase [Nocardioides thalensis]|uniref:Polyhydroxyalkanoate synthase n=1 Tax=Nocardioides thalensis TaxID=1914755 RepID=A0A853C4N6_9ACTN|nr:polyhydroxyalkanoate synthase [Nocardioides thalensis]
MPSPTLTSLATAARNAWAISPLGDGIEGYDGLPAEVVADAPHRRLVRYRRTTPATTARPVLLVPPLAVSTRCYDLRPGQSLVAHLLERGHDTWLVDYGDITFADRGMGFEDWIDDIIPGAVRTVSEAHGGAGVDIVAWSLGGTMSLLMAASHPDLPVSSITAFGTPIDYSKNPAVQGFALADKYLGTWLTTLPTAAMGGVPRHLVRTSYRAMAPKRELTKALYLARNILDPETLGRTEAVDDFISAMPGYPGRAYNQMHSRLFARNELATGRVQLSRHRTVDLANVDTRVLFVGSRTDNIGPAACVRAGVDVVPGARYRAADGLSHLGLVAGVRASEISWPLLDEFLAEEGDQPDGQWPWPAGASTRAGRNSASTSTTAPMNAPA